jgi:hypothetical protein
MTITQGHQIVMAPKFVIFHTAVMFSSAGAEIVFFHVIVTKCNYFKLKNPLYQCQLFFQEVLLAKAKRNLSM